MKIDTSAKRASFAKKRAGLDARVRLVLEAAALAAIEVARGLAPGRIGETITARSTTGAVAGVRVASSWAGAIFVENDTAPHVIAPKNGKVLRFVANGDVRFARSVNHPGTKGKHFMRAGREAGLMVLRAGLPRAIAGT